MAEKKIKVKLVHSTIGRVEKQEQIVKGLGLRKLYSVRELVDTPEVRGMIAKVSHLVKVVEVEDKPKTEKKVEAKEKVKVEAKAKTPKKAAAPKKKKTTAKGKSEVKQDEAK